MSDNPQRIAELIQQGKKLEAIKLLRETTGVSLQEAKEQVERLMIESTTGVAPRFQKPCKTWRGRGKRLRPSSNCAQRPGWGCEKRKSALMPSWKNKA